MSTRRLILLAMACGLAILVAGSVQLFRLSRSDNEVTILREGTSARVGEVEVTVEASRRDDEQVLVDVRLAVDPAEERPPVDVPASDNWSLLAAGELLGPVAPAQPGPLPPCVGSMLPPPGDEVQCTLAFAAGDGSKTIAYRRGDEQRQWALDA